MSSCQKVAEQLVESPNRGWSKRSYSREKKSWLAQVSYHFISVCFFKKRIIACICIEEVID